MIKLARAVAEIVLIILEYRLDPEKVARDMRQAALDRKDERLHDSKEALEDGDEKELVEAADDYLRDRRNHRMQQSETD